MNKAFLKFHYALLTLVTFLVAYRLFNRPLQEVEYIWILSPLPKSLSPALVAVALFVFCIFINIFNLIQSSYLTRFFSFVSFLALVSFNYSFGKISHVHHVWIISSFVFIFFDDFEPLNSMKNKLVVRIVQTWLLLQYFSSGLWKLRLNFPSITIGSIRETGLDHLAYGIVERAKQINIIHHFVIYESYWLIVLGFMFVIIFQIFCGICAFRQRGYLMCGILAVLFHSMTGISLGIWYISTAVSVIFSLVLAEVLFEAETVT